ncbi:MAG: cadherin-like beta sandwich domain-containing protein [Bacilli bacterium]|nr:cadherin-like beta sandwich domain-containing protein [Bacilli bacterium]
MFVIDMKKGFYISFFINIGLVILLITMTILYLTKGMPSKEENLGLQQLSITEADIDFSSTRYAYSIIVDETVDSLDLGYVPYEKSAEVKVEGNENFKEGYNQVVITVTEESKDDKTYYIDVEKIIEENEQE